MMHLLYYETAHELMM